MTQVVPFDLVDAVLEETCTVQRRLRVLPSRVGVYLVLAAGLFPQAGWVLVWSKLVAGLGGSGVVAMPSSTGLRALRRRIGPAPLRVLFEVLAGPVARPGTPGTCYRGYRTVAFDGCSSTKVADSEGLRRHLRWMPWSVGVSSYPRVAVLALAETGTRALIGAVFGPAHVGERDRARRLLPLLRRDMLVLADRGFDGVEFLTDLVATGAQVLVRAGASRRLPVLARLSDGTFLTRIGMVALRVVEVEIAVHGADGTLVADRYLLLTTLLDERADPGLALARLYHERWEIETAFLALRHTMLAGRVLRATDPAGLEQEVWALLCLYQVLRRAIVEACETVPGYDPDRAPFKAALEAARDSLVLAEDITDGETGLTRITRAVLEHPNPPRRARYSARTVKCPTSRYPGRYAALPDQPRPRTSTPVTRLGHTINPGPNPTVNRPATRPIPAPRIPPPPPRPRSTVTLADVQRLLDREPERRWKAIEIATALGERPDRYHSLKTRLGQWVKTGHIHRNETTHGSYTAAPLTHPHNH